MDINELLKGTKAQKFICELKLSKESEDFLKKLMQAYKDTKESCSEKFKG